MNIIFLVFVELFFFCKRPLYFFAILLFKYKKSTALVKILKLQKCFFVLEILKFHDAMQFLIMKQEIRFSE